MRPLQTRLIHSPSLDNRTKIDPSNSASPVFWFNDEQLLHQVLGVLVETFVEGIVQLFYLLENEEL